MIQTKSGVSMITAHLQMQIKSLYPPHWQGHSALRRLIGWSAAAAWRWVAFLQNWLCFNFKGTAQPKQTSHIKMNESTWVFITPDLIRMDPESSNCAIVGSTFTFSTPVSGKSSIAVPSTNHKNMDVDHAQKDLQPLYEIKVFFCTVVLKCVI